MADAEDTPTRAPDIASALVLQLRRFAGLEKPPIAAYTRVSRTPVRWGSLDQGTYGSYFPASRDIQINSDSLPQANPNDEYISNVLRHESVHAVLPPSTIDAIKQYFDANPAQAAIARENLSQYARDAGGSNKGLAQEAPAYAVQGYRFGLPDDIMAVYMSKMPDDVRTRYRKLLRK